MKNSALPSTITPDNLPELFYKDQPVITTESIAVVYGTEPIRIQQNFTRNKDRFIEGKHFLKLSGETLNDFRLCYSQANLRLSKSYSQVSDISQKTRSLMLWTERGGLLGMQKC